MTYAQLLHQIQISFFLALITVCVVVFLTAFSAVLIFQTIRHRKRRRHRQRSNIIASWEADGDWNTEHDDWEIIDGPAW